MTTQEFDELILKAEAGDVSAMNQVAHVYSDNGEFKDPQKAFIWYKKSAEQGDLNSISNLGGWCYLWGNGTEKNIALAIEWSEKAAAQNNAWSMIKLAQIYSTIDGYIDYLKAIKWFHLAVQKDYTKFDKSIYDKLQKIIRSKSDTQNLLKSIYSNRDCTRSLFYEPLFISTHSIEKAFDDIQKSEQQWLTYQRRLQIEADYPVDKLSPFASISGYFEIPQGTKRIGNNVFRLCDRITSISIPDSVTSIGESAFGNCDGLKSISVPNSVTSIGEAAFKNCSALILISLPKSLKNIGKDILNGCRNFVGIIIPEGTKKHFEKVLGTELSKILVESARSVDDLLQDIKWVQNEVLNQTNKVNDRLKQERIEKERQEQERLEALRSQIETNYNVCVKNPFKKLSGHFVVPKGTKRIGTEAFCNSYLTSVEIPDTITIIGSGAFFLCNNLKSIEIPKSVKIIGKDAFSHCSSLDAIVVAEDNKNYSSQDGVLFNKEKTELIFFPEGKNGDYAIPNGVSSIGANAFYICKGLTSVTIPNSVKSIGDGAFNSCSSLTSLYIPEGVTEINNGIVSSCTNLKLISLPASIEKIGPSTFNLCSKLEGIIVPVGTEVRFRELIGHLYGRLIIGSNHTYGEEQKDLEWLHKELQEKTRLKDEERAQWKEELKEIQRQHQEKMEKMRQKREEKEAADADTKEKEQRSKQLQAEQRSEQKVNEILDRHKKLMQEVRSQENHAQDGAEQDKQIIEMIETDYSIWKRSKMSILTEHFNIPKGVKRIGKRSFNQQKSIVSITIPKSVTEIGEDAFWGCENLVTVTILNKDTHIGKDAFSGCGNLKYVVVPKGTKEFYKNMVKSIWSYGMLSSKIIEDGEQDFI